ncbi:MAG: hypothetical protein NTU95_09585 [Methanothrix sp.]|nr:hypothetical protein [Methanothrix sp.]
MNASRFLGRFLFLLFPLLLLLAAGFSAQAGDSPAEGPHLQISSISGNLEVSRPSSIFVVLENNASTAEETDETGFNKANASSIVAELHSPDDRIKIFSGRQNAGQLAAGENATVQFMALADGAALGIYPLQLRLNYSRLSQVTASGEEGAPNFVFAYEKASIELPLQAEVVLGPKIEQEKLEGETLPKAESNLQVFLANRGDEPALDLEMQARPSPPFLMVENGQEKSSLAPGESALRSLSVFTDENATSGYYALPCRVSYRDGQDGGRKSQELALLIYVGEGAPSPWLYLGAAGLILLFLAGGFWGLRRFMSGRRRLRIVKS